MDKLKFMSIILTITNVYTLLLLIDEHNRVKKCLKMIKSNEEFLNNLNKDLIKIITENTQKEEKNG